MNSIQCPANDIHRSHQCNAGENCRVNPTLRVQPENDREAQTAKKVVLPGDSPATLAENDRRRSAVYNTYTPEDM